MYIDVKHLHDMDLRTYINMEHLYDMDLRT